LKDRKGQGYYRIDDVITRLGRTNMASFNLEMLCGEGSKKRMGQKVRVPAILTILKNFMSLLIFIFGKYRWQGKEIKGRLPINKGSAGLALATLSCVSPPLSLKRVGLPHTK